jgi:hypothetical protein|tara:strand:- start:24 stop:212 length:189 start_codon:yes stop_codon:yes gene_type:complete
MNNIIMFVVGSVIFIGYLFFYFRIVIRQHKVELTDTSYYDANDFDGIGNQGRFPDKKPKNRA